MILLSMTVKEIHDQLVADNPKIQIRIDKIRPKAIKEFKKARTFPVWYIDKYKIPASGNEHIIFYYANSVAEIERPHYQSFCVVFEDNKRFVIRGLSMLYKKTPDSDAVMLPQIHSYSSHFFQRYNERFLHNEEMSANEIAGLFFIRNPMPFPIKMNEGINRNSKDYGEFNGFGVRVNDGFCFVRTGIQSVDTDNGKKEAEGMLMIYTTFVNTLDMSDSQREAINEEIIATLKYCDENLEKYE